jgi:Transposase zinc-binding domain
MTWKSPAFDEIAICRIGPACARTRARTACQLEKLVAFSCKRRGSCPSCGGRRMAETAAYPLWALDGSSELYHGDLASPNVFVTFRGLSRLRGVECNFRTGLAEGFYARKLVLC